MYFTALLALTPSLLLHSVNAQDNSTEPQNVFINPPQPGPDHEYSKNNVYALGSTINLQWTTSWDAMQLLLWQNDNATYVTLEEDLQGVDTLSWNVDLTGLFSLDEGNVFFFWAVRYDNNDFHFASHYFNITEGITDSTSSSTSSSPASPPTARPNKTKAPHKNTQGSAGLSNSAEVGIGVGVGVGVGCLLIGVLIGFFIRRRRRASESESSEQSIYKDADPYNVDGYRYTGGNQGSLFQPHQQVSELQSERSVQELAANMNSQELIGSQKPTGELPTPKA